MVNIKLMISADLENITNLQPQGGCDDPNFNYYILLRCGNCGEVAPKESCISLNDTFPSAKGKGEIHLSQKCKFCSRDGTVMMIPGHGRPLTQELAESGQFVPLMLFDCRGYEPVDFSFGSGWQTESIEGTKFNEIDLSSGEFVEYDEKGQCPVSIMNLLSKFEVAK